VRGAVVRRAHEGHVERAVLALDSVVPVRAARVAAAGFDTIDDGRARRRTAQSKGMAILARRRRTNERTHLRSTSHLPKTSAPAGGTDKLAPGRLVSDCGPSHQLELLTAQRCRKGRDPNRRPSRR
jgi:hypothetical protein